MGHEIPSRLRVVVRHDLWDKDSGVEGLPDLLEVLCCLLEWAEHRVICASVRGNFHRPHFGVESHHGTGARGGHRFLEREEIGEHLFVERLDDGVVVFPPFIRGDAACDDRALVEVQDVVVQCADQFGYRSTLTKHWWP